MRETERKLKHQREEEISDVSDPVPTYDELWRSDPAVEEAGKEISEAERQLEPEWEEEISDGSYPQGKHLSILTLMIILS